MDLKKLIEQYYEDCKVMQLATSSNDQPWLCTVHFCTDEDMNLYWISDRSRRHSKEIINNPKVAVAVVKDIERKQALQIVGTAREVTIDDVQRVNKLYSDRFGDKPERLQSVLANHPDGRAYWVIKPTSISLWDEVNFPDNPKQEYLVSNS